MEIREYKTYCHDEIVNLYKSVGWKNYLERENVLMQAFANSLCVLGAYEGERLIGIVRAVGDGKTVVFVQDLLVLAEYQRKGVGTRLMKALMERFGDVYQMELLADDTEAARAFYSALGFKASNALGCVAYIKM